MFEQLQHNLLGVDRFHYIQNLVQFYVKEINEDLILDNIFTEKEKVLYGIKSFDG